VTQGRTISGLEKRVVVVGLYDLGSDEAVEWNPLMASVVVAMIPVVILFTLVRRCLTGVLTGGPLKASLSTSSGSTGYWLPKFGRLEDFGLANSSNFGEHPLYEAG
jgi:hypothetical protein